jgi:hypothetical protein
MGIRRVGEENMYDGLLHIDILGPSQSEDERKSVFPSLYSPSNPSLSYSPLISPRPFTADYKTSASSAWAQVHRWTLSKYLWEAPDSFEFFQAWRDKPLFVLSGFNFDEFLKTGTGDDLDEFANMFLTM